MDTRILALSPERLEDFKAYCRKHGQVVDDSFLYEEDLAEFQIHEEHPTYLAVNGEGEVVGAASMIADAYQRRGKQARFRIFHTETEDTAVYRRLLDEIVETWRRFGQYVYLCAVGEPRTDGARCAVRFSGGAVLLPAGERAAAACAL